MLVVIRVDSSSVIGSGHLMRCLTLACQLRKQHNAEICFICRDLDGNLSRLVEDAGFKLLLLPRGEKNTSLSGYEAWLTVPEIVDAKETYTVIERLEKKVDRLVVDSYAITAAWERRLPSCAGRYWRRPGQTVRPEGLPSPSPRPCPARFVPCRYGSRPP